MLGFRVLGFRVLGLGFLGGYPKIRVPYFGLLRLRMRLSRVLY